MELIKISDSKLKIALTPTDMERYSLDCDTMDYDKTETRSSFWQLLDEAKHQTGFDAASEKIFVQIYASVGGGCEMYVTKLKKAIDEGGEDEQPKVHTESDEKALTLCVKSTDEIIRCVYRVETMGELLRLCRFADCHFTVLSSSAYSGEEGKKAFYLVFEIRKKKGAGAEKIPMLSFLDEFGTLIPEKTLVYISEHCQCICERNAVRILSALI